MCVCVFMLIIHQTESKIMDFTTYLLVLSFPVLCCLYFLKQNSRLKNLPPGPYPLPIIGNIHQLGKYPIYSLEKLSKIYGPLMSLHLGSNYTVVASSPEMVKEILQKHDHNFTGRVNSMAAEAHDHNKFSIVLSSVGKRWTNSRKICKEQMFSTHRLDASEDLRQAMFQKLLEYVQKCCTAGQVIDIGKLAYTTTINLISNTLFSLDVTDYESHTAQDMKEIIQHLVQTIATPNVADFYPVLKRFDPQGIKRRSEILFGKLLDMFEKIINERLESRGKVPRKQDLLEALLDLDQGQGSNCALSMKEIKHLFVDLFTAGSDTTSSTIEWAMTELLLNPTKMSNAQSELKAVIGKNKKLVESDISKLPYLQAVIKETLRLHPPGPLLLPHKALDEVEINGYIIPKDTQVILNAWAVGRYPGVWSNPNSFEPERFLDCKIDFKGQDFQFIPFGSGRRMCPGLPMAHRTLHLTMTTLIHNFNWKLEPGMNIEDLNMDIKSGFALQKAVPLKCVPVNP